MCDVVGGRDDSCDLLCLDLETVEGGVAILAGILAGSIALIGFAIDSVIGGLASVVIIWRFTGGRVFSEGAETRAQRLVAIQFFILAPYAASSRSGRSSRASGPTSAGSASPSPPAAW